MKTSASLRRLAAAALVCGLALPAQAQQIIDTHVHVDGRLERRGDADWEGAARRAIERMDEAGVRLSLALPMPQPVNFPMPFDCDEYAAALRRFPGRFGIVCGGGTINPEIYASSPSLQRLESLVARYAGLGAVAIGELTAQHFSFNPRHPYLGMAPDHPAFLRLADLAAAHRLPLVIHMELARGAFDMPDGLRRLSSANPAQVADNLAAFERLLAHNRAATIVWSHFGWDNTGQRDGRIMRDLFARYPNLYADLKIQPGSPAARGALDQQGVPRPDFVAALEADAGRYMIGSDAFYSIRPLPMAREVDRLAGATQVLLRRLSPDAARRIGTDNAIAVYRLRERGLVR
jgi:predicted TIM-barrel fold metal-dependent hydrolase